MRSPLFYAIVVLFVFFLAGICKADLVTVTFEGPLYDVSSELAGRFSLDDLMQVSITYESSCPDSYSDPLLYPYPDNQGVYYCIQSFSVFVDSTVDSTRDYTATATDGWWTINNDFPAGESDQYDQVSAYILSPAASGGGTLAGPEVAGLPLWMFSLQLHDDSKTALSSDALPLSFDPYAFSNNQICLAWRDEGTNRWIKALDLSSTSYVVPMPGAFLLGMLGLSVAGVKLRKHS